MLTFFQINLKKIFKNTILVSSSLDQDQDQHSVSPDLGPNCLQRLTVDSKNHQELLKLLGPLITIGNHLDQGQAQRSGSTCLML